MKIPFLKNCNWNIIITKILRIYYESVTILSALFTFTYLAVQSVAYSYYFYFIDENTQN